MQWLLQERLESLRSQLALPSQQGQMMQPLAPALLLPLVRRFLLVHWTLPQHQLGQRMLLL